MVAGSTGRDRSVPADGSGVQHAPPERRVERQHALGHVALAAGEDRDVARGRAVAATGDRTVDRVTAGRLDARRRAPVSSVVCSSRRPVRRAISVTRGRASNVTRCSVAASRIDISSVVLRWPHGGRWNDTGGEREGAVQQHPRADEHRCPTTQAEHRAPARLDESVQENGGRDYRGGEDDESERVVGECSLHVVNRPCRCAIERLSRSKRSAAPGGGRNLVSVVHSNPPIFDGWKSSSSSFSTLGSTSGATFAVRSRSGSSGHRA